MNWFKLYKQWDTILVGGLGLAYWNHWYNLPNMIGEEDYSMDACSHYLLVGPLLISLTVIG